MTDYGLTPEERAGLEAPFEDSALEVNKGFTYIPVEHVIDRLNAVFDGNWDFVPYDITVGDAEERSSQNGEKTYTVRPVWATVILTVRSRSGAVVSRTGSGGSIIGYGKGEGDGHKGAISDALKKAAQSLGVGLYIAKEAREQRKSSRKRSGGGGSNNRSVPLPNSAPSAGGESRQRAGVPLPPR